RTKTFLKVKVYAAGLYADAAALKTALAAYKGRSAGELAKDKDVRKLMLSDDFEKSIRLVMARDVDGDDMAEAFSESVEPRVARQGAAAVRALATFKGYFTMDEVKEGSDLVFTWGKGGKLTTALAGKTMGTIESEAFCRALYEVFLGSGAVSPGLKSSVYKGVERALAP
ncbi:MAG: chalcone isomerase family protein, partial [Myxococcota bacterium]